MFSNFYGYVWNGVDGLVAVSTILAIFIGTIAFWLFSELFADMNQRLPPARRFPSRALSQWGGIIRTHRELFPEHRARRLMWYFVGATAGLVTLLVTRALYLGAAFPRR